MNFGYLYGMHEKKFQATARQKYQLHLTIEECARHRKRWFQTNPEISDWHERQRRLVMKYGEVQSAIGRIRRLPDSQSNEPAVREEAVRQAINSPIQGLANDLCNLAGVMAKEQIPEDKFKIAGFHHDAVLFYVREDCIDEVGSKLKEIMEHLPLEKLFGTIMTVPMEVEIKIGDHWGEGELWTAA